MRIDSGLTCEGGVLKWATELAAGPRLFNHAKFNFLPSYNVLLDYSAKHFYIRQN